MNPVLAAIFAMWTAVLLLLACAPAAPRRSAAPPVAAVPSGTAQGQQLDSTALTWAFTQQGQHPDRLMIAGIDQAASRVDAALYAFNNTQIAQALVSAEQRCNCVRLISDRTQSGGKSQVAVLTTVHAAGIPVRTDTHTGIMHMKMIVIDDKTVFEGSFNATTAASTVNDEILVRIDQPKMAHAFGLEFDTMWTDTKRFHDWMPPITPTLPAPEVPEF